MTTNNASAPKSVLLIISGGIAAYKTLFLIRLLRAEGIGVTPVLTAAGEKFVTPLSLASLSEEKCYTDLFDLKDEVEMGHIELSRAADLVVCVPATADLLAKQAAGLANDLASTLLLATDKTVLMAPAMNVRMWEHAATQRNIRQLKEDGVQFVGPDVGSMACGEFGEGRMAEPEAILAKIIEQLSGAAAPALVRPASGGQLSGRKLLITAGPTHEPLDPVRYIANRSSGKQGYAIAAAAVAAGADVTLVSGPTNLADVPGVKMVRVETARQMMDACTQALPADVAIMCAAVADYRPEIETEHKIKKERGGLSAIALVENPDILATISQLAEDRPALVVGFAAETDDVLGHAEAKRARKKCDWIVANDVSPGTDVMGGDRNAVIVLSDDGEERWEDAPKSEISRLLIERIADHFKG